MTCKNCGSPKSLQEIGTAKSSYMFKTNIPLLACRDCGSVFIDTSWLGTRRPAEGPYGATYCKENGLPSLIKSK